MIQKKKRPMDPILGKVISEGAVLGQDLRTIDLSKPFVDVKPMPEGNVRTDFLNVNMKGALLDAVENSDAEKVRDCIAKGASPNTWCVSGTALTLAAKRGNLEIVNMLLDAGADINKSEGDDGKVPIDYAAGYDTRLEMLKLLIKRGANVNGNNMGFTPLHNAVKNENALGVIILIEAGADVNFQDMQGATALMGAAVNGMLGTVVGLVDAGADANYKDERGLTAFNYAVSYREKDCAKYLRPLTKLGIRDLMGLPARHVWAYITY